jgi:DNA polymerase-1
MGLELDANDPESINRIKSEAPELRQLAKPIAFLKIYGGGAGKIQKVMKCSIERARAINDAFDELYKVTVQFNENNIALAKKQGYLEVAFGLKVQCPRINSKDNGVASGEARSVNNASSQSYGMLTNHASIEFLNRLKASEEKLNVKLVNQVHDCIYGIAKINPITIKWINDNLIDCMEWKDDPALEGPVDMTAELDLGLDAAHCKTIKNKATLEEIEEFLKGL